MDSHALLWGEIAALVRGLKDLNNHAIAASGIKLEPAGVHVIGRLATLGPVRLTELAQALGLDPSSVSRQVTAVERAGYVSREGDPDDGRATLLVLTEKGRQAAASVQQKRAQALKVLTPGWSDTDHEELAARLARLNNDLSAHGHLLDAELETA
ncbi:MAG: MarR family transcriptional regulator [Frankiales bacterium]|jgi:DNA-binding MarR family transcriptional regulator|nr:MarR family transcriptional regulator [Frankiales bacterium]